MAPTGHRARRLQDRPVATGTGAAIASVWTFALPVPDPPFARAAPDPPFARAARVA